MRGLDAVPRPAPALWLFGAQQLSGRSIDEMQPVAGLADHGFVTGWRIVHGFIQPVLYVQAGMRTSEDEITHNQAVWPLPDFSP